MIAGGTFINAKAGMESMDKDLIARTVFELSKDSPFYANEQRKAAKLDVKIAAMAVMLRQPLPKSQAAAAEREVAREAAELEAQRDLQRTHLVVDMDAFYAAVEERADPTLKGQIFAVGGVGMICTASYAARQYGVRSAMPGFIAQELCKRQGVRLRFVPTHFELYKQASDALRPLFKALDPGYSMGSLDEAYCDITEYCAVNRLEPSVVAETLRRNVREVSDGLTCSIGVAPTRFIAKISSDKNKPDGQYIVPATREAVLEFLRELPCRKVGGIGNGCTPVLAYLPGCARAQLLLHSSQT